MGRTESTRRRPTVGSIVVLSRFPELFLINTNLILSVGITAFVILAKAGICLLFQEDSRLRGNDMIPGNVFQMSFRLGRIYGNTISTINLSTPDSFSLMRNTGLFWNGTVESVVDFSWFSVFSRIRSMRKHFLNSELISFRNHQQQELDLLFATDCKLTSASAVDTGAYPTASGISNWTVRYPRMTLPRIDQNNSALCRRY